MFVKTITGNCNVSFLMVMGMSRGASLFVIGLLFEIVSLGANLPNNRLNV